MGRYRLYIFYFIFIRHLYHNNSRMSQRLCGRRAYTLLILLLLLLLLLRVHGGIE